jgi:hypothetical protein
MSQHITARGYSIIGSSPILACVCNNQDVGSP